MHDPVVSVIFFVLGAAVGSFTNVLIWRLPRGESIISPGSHCPHCGAKIKFYDNIPIVSYLVLGGRCRNCGERISPRYPLVEFAMAVLYTGTYLLLNPADIATIIEVVVLLPIFVAISWIDFEHYVIPDELTLSIALFGIVFNGIVGGFERILMGFLGAVIGLGLFYAIGFLGKRAFRREALGEGDIFLMGSVGFLVGWKGVLLVSFLAALMGAVFGVVVMALRGNRDDTEKIVVPFGPFICAATLVAIIWGEKIIRWYLDFMA